MPDDSPKLKYTTIRELLNRGTSEHGRAIDQNIRDHIRHSPTKVWLILGEGKVFFVKDMIRGFVLHFSYYDNRFIFRDHRGQEKEIHEDEIKGVEGF